MLCRLFLTLLHGIIIGQILPFQFLWVRRCPQTDGVVVNIHLLMPLAIYPFRLGYHDFQIGNSWTISDFNSVSRVTCLAHSMNYCRSAALSVVASKLAAISGITAFNCFYSVSRDTVSVAKRSSVSRPLVVSS